MEGALNSLSKGRGGEAREHGGGERGWGGRGRKRESVQGRLWRGRMREGGGGGRGRQRRGRRGRGKGGGVGGGEVVVE